MEHVTTQPTLPAQVQVIVRDWLNANQILLRGRDGNVLIDTGYVTRAATTLALVRDRLGGERVDLLVNTHCHSDHMGCNAAVQRVYVCPTLIPEAEAALIRDWDVRALWIDYTGQQAERFAFDGVLKPGAIHRWGDLDWQMLPAPGHDAGALIFWNEAERILISGDALWERGFGLVMPEPESALHDAKRTLESIAALNPRIVIPGHGTPFTDVGAALERCFGRLQASLGNPERMTRHAFKAMLTFILLDKGGMPLAELPEYLSQIPFYREFNERYLQRPPAALAQLLVSELEKVGAVERRDGWLFATR
jgi:glyoxylase-like metal-dependent hydrolase (beta-lactamase superfamily II)